MKFNNITKNSHLCCFAQLLALLWKECDGDGGIERWLVVARQRASNVESFSMSWCHYVSFRVITDWQKYIIWEAGQIKNGYVFLWFNLKFFSEILKQICNCFRIHIHLNTEKECHIWRFVDFRKIILNLFEGQQHLDQVLCLLVSERNSFISCSFSEMAMICLIMIISDNGQNITILYGNFCK